MFTAADVREWADATGTTRPKRGPVPRSLVIRFLAAHPRTAREVAAKAGVPVGARGPLSAETVEKIAATV